MQLAQEDLLDMISQALQVQWDHNLYSQCCLGNRFHS